ncbi:MAG TPA: transposase [Planctomycetaceae bacterium]|jgi:transposase
MNDREQRGLQIAALCQIDRKGSVYLVPAQSGRGKYTVCPDHDNPHCSCPDHETRGVVCKHIFAVRCVQKREQSMDGITTTLTQTVTITEEKRKTYAQNWPAYDRAQMHEKEKFRSLLHDLCEGIEEPSAGKGRPRISLADAIFSAAYKVYSTVSGRRFMTDLREAHAAGFIERMPCFSSLMGCLESEAVTPILTAMIVQSSLPLKSVEVDFAVDSSGFTTSRFIKWFDHKYGKPRQEHEWVKVHLMCGVKTNVVTAVEIRGKDAQDCPLLPDLVKTTAKNFSVQEVSGDKAYGSFKNYDAISAVGATPFIPFKTHQGFSGKHKLWGQMFHYFMFRREEFCQHYHKRSNVESTFGMIKAKFRDHVRSKTDVAMRNEALCKILCHNICCLISAMYELGIEPEFWGEKGDAAKIG